MPDRDHPRHLIKELSRGTLDALWTLARGLYLPDETCVDLHQLYQDLIIVILRLITLTYLEGEDLLTEERSESPQRFTPIADLFERLERERDDPHHDLSERDGAWRSLLLLTDTLYRGGELQGASLPPRRGQLFAPQRFRVSSHEAQSEEQLTLSWSDHWIHQALKSLLKIKGERLSYQAVGVELIGSVYESLIDYQLRRASTYSVIVGAQDHAVSLPDLLKIPSLERPKWLKRTVGVIFSKSKDQEALQDLISADSISAIAQSLTSKLSPRMPSALSPGDLYLSTSEKRRESGSHYTPQSLSIPVVREALRPHLERIGRLPLDQQERALLTLKICDPAMGSGAFLIESCQQLADALIKVRARVPTSDDRALNINQARREVAQACLYGVDQDPNAVMCAQISLWLFTRSQSEPFDCLDRALRCGDSLIGLSADQWRALHPTFDAPRYLKAASQVESSRLKFISDVIVRLSLQEGQRGQRDKRRATFINKVKTYLNCLVRGDVGEELSSFKRVEASAEQLKRPTYNHRSHNPLHWVIDFPEESEAGFDCIVGNPPFVGGRQVTETMGHAYQDWLIWSFAQGRRSADLCSYFFRRAFQLLREGGTLSFVATKSISEGVTRAVGLQWICAHGGVIYHATRRLAWPGRGAEIKVSVVHLYKGRYEGQRLLDGVSVSEISDGLTQFSLRARPQKLSGNRGLAFQGSITLGMGFTFDDQSKRANSLKRMREILDKRPLSSERIFPYLGGHELNTDPHHRHHRYVINFESMSLAEAERWPELVQILREAIYPHRSTHKNPMIRAYPWWQHWNRRETLYNAIRSAPRVLLTNAQAAAHLCFSFYTGRAIFANSINVINLSDWASFALLQSRVHEVWARHLSSHLGDQIRYNPTTCFETYPRPTQNLERVSEIGKRYHDFREALMGDHQTRRALMGDDQLEGLTETYNRFHQPTCELSGIMTLRDLHAELDRRVADAMGWSDLALEYTWIDEFTGQVIGDRALGDQSELSRASKIRPHQGEVKVRLTFTPQVKREVLERLLELNQEHARRG